MKNGLTIALLGRNFGWGGGVDFLRHVANGLLAKQQTHGLKIYLLLPVENKIDTPVDILRMVKRSIKGTVQRKRLWIARPWPDFHNSMLDFFQHTQGGNIEIVYHESSQNGLLRCLQRLKADVALPVNGTLGECFPIPWVGYLYDFQHRYLPENFTPRVCLGRDGVFASTLRDSPTAIVNSHAVKDDIFKYYPYVDKEIFSLPFSPNPLPEWFEPCVDDVRGKYQLPEKYFLISNQFWIHKDHMTAFKALKLNNGFNKNVSIICTGTMGDPRRPDYMDQINNYLDDNGISARIKLLGHIPKRDQIEIMKAALAVVQPTLFEGGPGGGCVYDAVSLGVPVILSDIPVNKEVDAKNIWFFRAGCSEDLADKMRVVLREDIERPSRQVLLDTGRMNLEKLGDCLLDAVSCAIEKYSTPLLPGKAK